MYCNSILSTPRCYGGHETLFLAIHDTKKREGESFETTCRKDWNGTLKTLGVNSKS